MSNPKQKWPRGTVLVLDNFDHVVVHEWNDGVYEAEDGQKFTDDLIIGEPTPEDE